MLPATNGQIHRFTIQFFQHHAAAQVELGVQYYFGIGAPQDRSRAYFWFQRAADAGSPEAVDVLKRLRTGV